jgi:hypothetical protein
MGRRTESMCQSRGVLDLPDCQPQLSECVIDAAEVPPNKFDRQDREGEFTPSLAADPIEPVC